MSHKGIQESHQAVEGQYLAVLARISLRDDSQLYVYCWAPIKAEDEFLCPSWHEMDAELNLVKQSEPKKGWVSHQVLKLFQLAKEWNSSKDDALHG